MNDKDNHIRKVTRLTANWRPGMNGNPIEGSKTCRDTSLDMYNPFMNGTLARVTNLYRIRFESICIPTEQDSDKIGIRYERLYSHTDDSCTIRPVLTFTVMEDDTPVKKGTILSQPGVAVSFLVFDKDRAYLETRLDFIFSEEPFSEAALRQKLLDWARENNIRFG